jgi:hypothetical protein
LTLAIVRCRIYCPVWNASMTIRMKHAEHRRMLDDAVYHSPPGGETLWFIYGEEVKKRPNQRKLHPVWEQLVT